MWKEPLGGKPLNIAEHTKINPRFKGASSKKIYQELKRAGIIRERIEPAIKSICSRIFRNLPFFDVEYTSEQGKTVRKRPAVFEGGLLENINHYYTMFKKAKLTHRGRKRIKDDLIRFLLLALTATKYPKLMWETRMGLTLEESRKEHEGFHYLANRFSEPLYDFLLKKVEKDLENLDIENFAEEDVENLAEEYVENLDIRNLAEECGMDLENFAGGLAMPFALMFYDKHYFDVGMGFENIALSLREETICEENPKFSEDIAPIYEEIHMKVQLDLIKNIGLRSGVKKNISMDWIYLAMLVYSYRAFERQAKVKVLKPNTQLCDIWGISPETLKRRLAYLRQL